MNIMKLKMLFTLVAKGPITLACVCYILNLSYILHSSSLNELFMRYSSNIMTNMDNMNPYRFMNFKEESLMSCPYCYLLGKTLPFKENTGCHNPSCLKDWIKLIIHSSQDSLASSGIALPWDSTVVSAGLILPSRSTS